MHVSRTHASESHGADDRCHESGDRVAVVGGRARSVLPHSRLRVWFAKLERLSASPSAAVAIARMVIQMDVSDVLPTIRVPTLVLRKRDDRGRSARGGEYIADHIPGAKFVELPGDRSLAVERTGESRRGDPGIPHRDARQRRAGSRHGDGDVRRHRRLRERAAKLGDRRWADLLGTSTGSPSGHSTAPAASAGRRLLRPSVSRIIERG